MANYSLMFPTITTSNCTAGTNCAIGASCTASSQCSTGGCCGYYMDLASMTNSSAVILQYAGTYSMVGTKIVTASNYTYNALIAAYYLA